MDKLGDGTSLNRGGDCFCWGVRAGQLHHVQQGSAPSIKWVGVSRSDWEPDEMVSCPPPIAEPGQRIDV